MIEYASACSLFVYLPSEETPRLMPLAAILAIQYMPTAHAQAGSQEVPRYSVYRFHPC